MRGKQGLVVREVWGRHLASEESRGQMGLNGLCPKLIIILLVCAVQCPERGCQVATDLGLDLGFAKRPCDLGIFCVLSGTYILFKL